MIIAILALLLLSAATIFLLVLATAFAKDGMLSAATICANTAIFTMLVMVLAAISSLIIAIAG